MIETNILNIKKYKNFLLKAFTFYSIIFFIFVANLELKLLYVQADWIFSRDTDFKKKYKDLIKNKSYQKDSPLILNYLTANKEKLITDINNNFTSKIKEYTQILAQEEKQKIKKEQKKFIVKQFIDVASKKTTYITHGHYSDKEEIENFIYYFHNQYKEEILEDLLFDIFNEQKKNYNLLIENERNRIEMISSQVFYLLQNINSKIEVMYPGLLKLDIQKKKKIAENIKSDFNISLVNNLQENISLANNFQEHFKNLETFFQLQNINQTQLQNINQIQSNNLKIINLIEVILSTKIEDIDLNKLMLTNELLTYFENFKFLNSINDTQKKINMQNLKYIELIDYKISKLSEKEIEIKNILGNLIPEPKIKFTYKNFFWYLMLIILLLSVILSLITLYIKILLKSDK